MGGKANKWQGEGPCLAAWAGCIRSEWEVTNWCLILSLFWMNPFCLCLPLPESRNIQKCCGVIHFACGYHKSSLGHKKVPSSWEIDSTKAADHFRAWGPCLSKTGPLYPVDRVGKQHLLPRHLHDRDHVKASFGTSLKRPS